MAILLIKVNFTKIIKGITFAKKESQSETFADNTSFFMLREEEYIHAAMSYLDAFSKISGLKCNISKTKVIHIGLFDKDNKLCPDIKLNCEDNFTLLGFYIDNKLEELETNIDKIELKVNNLINTWHHYQLSTWMDNNS